MKIDCFALIILIFVSSSVLAINTDSTVDITSVTSYKTTETNLNSLKERRKLPLLSTTTINRYEYISMVSLSRNFEYLSKSTSNEERRYAYVFMLEMYDNVANITCNFDKEKNIINKRILAILGYQLYPESKLWRKRFLKYYPRTSKELNEIYDFAEQNKLYPPLERSVYSIEKGAEKDNELLHLLFNVYFIYDGGMAELGEESVFKLSNKYPERVLYQLRKLPPNDQDQILSDIAGMDLDISSINTFPFIKKLTQLSKSKHVLSSYANVVLNKLKKYTKEYEEDENKGK